MQSLINKLEQTSELSGRLISWLTLFIVLVTFLVVVLRYVFEAGSIALQESITYMHAMVFMIGAAYTLKHDGHVRVDIFYQQCSKQKRAIIDLLGNIFLLLPVCLFIIYSSWDYVLTSWTLQEESGEAGGLAYVYILKTCLLLMPLLLIIQALASSLTNLLILKNNKNTHV